MKYISKGVDMTLREQFEKETGLKADSRADVYELLDVESKYVSWLEDKIEQHSKNVENTTSETNNSAINPICRQKLSCRFQQFADKVRCGAPSVMNCTNKQYQ